MHCILLCRIEALKQDLWHYFSEMSSLDRVHRAWYKLTSPRHSSALLSRKIRASFYAWRHVYSFPPSFSLSSLKMWNSSFPWRCARPSSLDLLPQKCIPPPSPKGVFALIPQLLVLLPWKYRPPLLPEDVPAIFPQPSALLPQQCIPPLLSEDMPAILPQPLVLISWKYGPHLPTVDLLLQQSITPLRPLPANCPPPLLSILLFLWGVPSFWPSVEHDPPHSLLSVSLQEQRKPSVTLTHDPLSSALRFQRDRSPPTACSSSSAFSLVEWVRISLVFFGLPSIFSSSEHILPEKDWSSTIN